MGDIIFLVLSALQIGDILILRKGHPCGGNEWKVLRVGVDISLVCQKCGRQVWVERRELDRRVKKIIPRGQND